MSTRVIHRSCRHAASDEAFWLADFSAVPAEARRAARYALHMMAQCPALRASLDDDDFLGAMWLLAMPLVEPQALVRRQKLWWADTDVPDDGELQAWEEFSRRWKRYGLCQRPLPKGEAGKRMRADLRECFLALPDELLARLTAADDAAPVNPAVDLLARAVLLDDVEVAVLDFTAMRQHNRVFRTMLRMVDVRQPADKYACLSAALGIPVRELKPRLRRAADLRAFDLLRVASEADLEDFLCGGDLLDDILDAEPATAEELLACIVETPPAAQCRPDDFPHLEKDALRLRTALSGALLRGERGVNALLYGAPGTGKTQFALAIAAAAGLKPVMVKTADEDGDGLARDGRLGAYRLAQRLLHGRRDCVIVFDEVEDVFRSAGSAFLALLNDEAGAGNAKGWMNRCLEENPLPAIWITNDATGMDSAFLRRFLLPVHFITPPRPVRRRIAEHHLGGRALPAALLDELAVDAALLPAHFDTARRLLDLQPEADPAAVVREGLGAVRRLLHGSALPRRRESTLPFDAAYLNLAGGIAPARIAGALMRSGRASLCFYGPPGSGKTEFAHVLADALGRELVARSTADLLSPYVGQTEQNIARLFGEIDPEHTVLFLDEVDSLLRDRRLARHGWETTQVNELLQQMECFPGIFIAATNLAAQLDAAALRRFDFKLHFRPLAPAQRHALFARETLGDEGRAGELPPAILRALDGLEGLTPGDFANVVRQRELLGVEWSVEDFVRRLAMEGRWKRTQERSS